MDPPQTPPPPNFSQKPKFHFFFFEAFPYYTNPPGPGYHNCTEVQRNYATPNPRVTTAAN